ncbi:MAG: hypothetical protein H7066_05895 [Cytophagaceae bacterium]|nr:hypothetical protein [Gemmatimonadaceae bacterium]
MAPPAQRAGTAAQPFALRAQHATAGPASRLVATTVPVATLDRATIDDAFALFEGLYEGVERARFERDLAEKQRIILLRDIATHTLRGFSTVLIQEEPEGTVIFSGDTVIDRAYWGQKQLQFAFAKVLLSIKLQSPRRALYWFLISKGYRTYLLLANSFPHAIPRRDRPDDPRLGSLLDTLAAGRYGAQYDRRTRIIRLTTAHDRVRDGAAPVTERHLQNPHVRFFVERNPEHQAGDELACLAHVRLQDILRGVTRVGLAQFRAMLRLPPVPQR